MDSPRPSLGKDDKFEVDPLCRDLIVDSQALAPVPVIVTLTGKRRDTGIGAESVPVAITRGACSESGASGDAGPSDAVDAAVEGQVHACTSDAPQLAKNLFTKVELAQSPLNGCRWRSPARVDCTLDPRGEASFGVISYLSESDITTPGYVPLCIRPLELGFEDTDAGSTERTSTRFHEHEVWVLPRAGHARLALATVAVDQAARNVVSAASTACASLFDCDAPRSRGTLRAGFASTEIALSALQATDFVEATSTVNVQAVLSVVAEPTTGALYLSRDSGCASTERAQTLDLTIAQGEKATATFQVCGPAHAATYSVITRLAGSGDEVGDAGVADGGAEEEDATDTSGVLVRAFEASVESQTKGYAAASAEDEAEVETLSCDGSSRATSASGPLVVRPPLASNNDGNVVVVCGDDDGGAPSCGARTFSVELKDGSASCSLELPAP